MNLKSTKLGRVGAFVTTLALATLGVATAANADDATGGFTAPDKDKSVTLNIYKYAVDEMPESETGEYTGTEGPLEGKTGLVGVDFEVQQLGTTVDGKCVAPDLGTPAGWEAIKNATVDNCTIGEATTVTTGEGGLATFTSETQGLYKVTEVASGNNLIAQKSAPFLVTLPMPLKNGWKYTVDAYPKNVLTEASATKVAGDPTAKVVKDDTLVPWTITVGVPKLALPYTSIVISDTVGEGLAFNKVTSVKLGDQDLDYTAKDGVITLNDDALEAVNALEGDGKIVVTVNTTVSKAGKLENNASAKLNGQSAEADTAYTLWGQFNLVKKDNEGNLLEGAEFNVYEGACSDDVLATDPVVSLKTNAKGEASEILYVSNDATQTTKDYCLKETKAPSGYILDNDAQTITVNAEEAISKDLVNVKVEGPKLPVTGLQGTAALTGAGLILLAAGSGLVYFARRRSA